MKKILLLLVALLALSANAVTINVGYNFADETIYQYDGIGGLDKDTKASALIMLTPDMLRPYAGAKITSLRIGWSDPEHSSPCTIFIRTAMDSQKGEVLAQGSSTLKYLGNYEWNVIKFDAAYVIPEEPETLYVGYTCEVAKNAFPLAKLYPINQKGSNYVWRADLDKDNEGNEIWTDLCDMGALAIQAVVDGTSAQLNNLLDVTGFTYFPVQTLGSTATSGTLQVKNMGANSITKFTLTYELNGETYDQTVSCSSIAKGASTKLTIPVYGMGSGKGTVRVSKIGSAKNRIEKSFDFDMVSIPADVAKKFKRRPLIEFFESEGEYRVPVYYDDYFMPGYLKHKEEVTLVAHHLNDQFMLGRDEATTMMIDFADGDLYQVSIPSLMFDRTKQAANPSCLLDAPYEFIVFEWFADQYCYNPALAIPTFVNLDIACTNAAHNVFEVRGEIGQGVLNDEDLYLTVYVVEDNVETDSQDKPVRYDDKDDKDDKKAPAAGPRKEDDKEQIAPGYYVHDNVIRERLTPMYGVNIGHDATFAKEFQFEMDDEYKYNDLRFVAFVHRANEGHDRFHRNVFNSCEKSIVDLFGEEGEIIGINGTTIPSLRNTYYDLQGRTAKQNANGIMIKNGKKVINK